MKFISLSVKNFRQYEELDFDLVKGTSQFVVVQANIGQGKTTFINAILWCLYGIEHESTEGINSVANERALERSKNGESVNVEVSLRLELDDGSTAVVKREQPFQSVGNDGIPTAQSKVSVVHVKDARVGADSIKNPQLWVEKLLPNRLFPYFIFNGENASLYFANNSQIEVRNAVLRIARVDVLQRMKSHLEKVKDEIRSDARKADPAGLSNADSAINRIRGEIESLTSRENEISTAIKDFDEENLMLKERVENSTKMRGLLHLRDTAQNKLNDFERELEKTNQDLAEWAGLNSSLFFGDSALVALAEAVEDSKKAGKYPPDFQAVALKRLLDSGSCICGRDLKNDHTAEKHIQTLLEDFAEAGPRGTELQILNSHLTIFKDRKADASKEYSDLLKIRAAIIKDIDEISDELAGLNVQVGDGGTMDEVQIWDQLTSLLQSRKDKEVELSLIAAEIAVKNSELDKANSEYARLVSQSESAKKLSNELEFLSDAIEQIDQVYNNILSKVLSIVGTALKENWENWHSKDQPEEILLTEDFQIYKINAAGQRTTFSKGEYRLLYYCLCFAARLVSGFKFPLLIDSPWGNMDTSTRKSLATELVNKLDDSQTALFVLDSEFPSEISSILAAGKPRLYQINLESAHDYKRSTITEIKG